MVVIVAVAAVGYPVNFYGDQHGTTYHVSSFVSLFHVSVEYYRWTRQRWMMRTPYLVGFVVAVITAVALVPAFTYSDLEGEIHVQCGEDPTSQQFRQRVLNALIVIFSPQIGWLLIVVIRMIQRHSRESYGLVNEFLWLMIGVPMFPVAAVLVKALHMTSSDGGSLLLVYDRTVTHLL